MGLFSRNQQEDNETELLDSPGLPNSQDLNGEYFEPEAPLVAAPAPKPVRPSLSYGIEDAIGLMRKLPKDNKEVVVSVVKQTLESTNISIDDIIADATDKEERLLNKNAQLEKEIKDLQAQIAARNKQISELLADHKETVGVREQLQLANQLSRPEQPVTARKAAPQAQASAGASAATQPPRAPKAAAPAPAAEDPENPSLPH
ncbi:hypothetical protein L1F30_07705 [Simiduia sp. 21SJ11W-1]|uniref:hypothetical protein n=1 Tax=Simiduia sp. 21SJ11W-1 TaxID=2909669 RepID=UPI0020A0B1A3|nr:hypothetical protein [Simiduia sp. 21SJ11W-1]UTA49412.1 hypothetical protein L1F30_07705 [Simiduia sp. 21SJ11W-1]